MNPELKAKWVEALRSGEFKQGSNKLHDPDTDSYCCLGVLCKIVGTQWTEFQEIEEQEDGWVTNNYQYVPILDGKLLASGDDEELKSSVCSEFGIPDQGKLIEMNDGFLEPKHVEHKPPKPFPEIADYIEANL